MVCGARDAGGSAHPLLPKRLPEQTFDYGGQRNPLSRHRVGFPGPAGHPLGFPSAWIRAEGCAQPRGPTPGLAAVAGEVPHKLKGWG